MQQEKDTEPSSAHCSLLLLGSPMNRQGLNWHDVHYCNVDDQLLMIEIKPMMETKTMIKAMRKTMNKMMVKTMIKTMIQIMLRLMVKDREPLPLLLGWWPTSKQIDDDHNCNSVDRDDEQDGSRD